MGSFSLLLALVGLLAFGAAGSHLPTRPTQARVNRLKVYFDEVVRLQRELERLQSRRKKTPANASLYHPEKEWQLRKALGAMIFKIRSLLPTTGSKRQPLDPKQAYSALKGKLSKIDKGWKKQMKKIQALKSVPLPLLYDAYLYCLNTRGHGSEKVFSYPKVVPEPKRKFKGKSWAKKNLVNPLLEVADDILRGEIVSSVPIASRLEYLAETDPDCSAIVSAMEIPIPLWELDEGWMGMLPSLSTAQRATFWIQYVLERQNHRSVRPVKEVKSTLSGLGGKELRSVESHLATQRTQFIARLRDAATSGEFSLKGVDKVSLLRRIDGLADSTRWQIGIDENGQTRLIPTDELRWKQRLQAISRSYHQHRHNGTRRIYQKRPVRLPLTDRQSLSLWLQAGDKKSLLGYSASESGLVPDNRAMVAATGLAAPGVSVAASSFSDLLIDEGLDMLGAQPTLSTSGSREKFEGVPRTNDGGIPLSQSSEVQSRIKEIQFLAHRLGLLRTRYRLPPWEAKTMTKWMGYLEKVSAAPVDTEKIVFQIANLLLGRRWSYQQIEWLLYHELPQGTQKLRLAIYQNLQDHFALSSIRRQKDSFGSENQAKLSRLLGNREDRARFLAGLRAMHRKMQTFNPSRATNLLKSLSSWAGYGKAYQQAIKSVKAEEQKGEAQYRQASFEVVRLMEKYHFDLKQVREFLPEWKTYLSTSPKLKMFRTVVDRSIALSEKRVAAQAQEKRRQRVLKLKKQVHLHRDVASSLKLVKVPDPVRRQMSQELKLPNAHQLHQELKSALAVDDPGDIVRLEALGRRYERWIHEARNYNQSARKLLAKFEKEQIEKTQKARAQKEKERTKLRTCSCRPEWSQGDTDALCVVRNGKQKAITWVWRMSSDPNCRAHCRKQTNLVKPVPLVFREKTKDHCDTLNGSKL